MSHHKIVVNNFNSGDTVCHSTILLKGQIFCNANCTELNSYVNTQHRRHPLVGDRFKCLLEVERGRNTIVLMHCGFSIDFVVNYEPRSTDYCVMPVYIVCKNHDGRFQSPDVDNGVESACLRIGLGAKLLQCLISEKFYGDGLERRTFQLESDLRAVPACRVFYSSLDVDRARLLNPEELWSTFAHELLSEYGNVKCKYLAFISCTRYRGDKYSETMMNDDFGGITEANAALGGGGLAVFGSACLYTWPTNICEVIKCFDDVRVIDKRRFLDQSSCRGTYGSCFSTTLGAVCHELCHTFDLGHTNEGIMGRQYNEIHTEFLQHKHKYNRQNLKARLPDRINYKRVDCERKRGIFWTKSCLAILYYHKWFNPCDVTDNIIFDPQTGIVSSKCGICAVELRHPDNGLVLKWWDFSNEPLQTFEIPHLNSLHLGKNVVMVAEDTGGNLLKQKL